MQEWLKYSIYLIILYTIWTIIFEYIVKKHTSCFCITLKTYIIAGILAFIYLIYHIKHNCKHFNNLSDIKNISSVLLLLIVFMALCVLITNKLWINALDHNVNAGYIGSISNMYIILVTIISAYLFNSNITKKNIFGIIIMITGAYLIST